MARHSGRRIGVALALGAVLVSVTSLVLSHRPKPLAKASSTGYVDSATCARCHTTEAAGYARTGMAHAFSEPDARDRELADFYHAASGTYYRQQMVDGKLVQQRWLRGPDGGRDAFEQLSVDYVMGSGNHARAYLHREQNGSLIELPLAWYAEGGGQWGMNPGFDTAKPRTRRTIAYECMFCHNGYPLIPDPAHRDLPANPVYRGALPEGIDCQRCHGPGAEHVRAATTAGVAPGAVRAAILNPVRLSKAGQMEVCEQCHLETTSHLLPDRVRHYDRAPFSYRAGQPLADFNAYFQRNPDSGTTDNFEIVSAPYRLRQSRCYLKSAGALTCETCHDPHDLHKGPASASYYAGVCMTCHGATLPERIARHEHPSSEDCVSCHMPRRRTEDVVHAVMTDHLIQRRPPPARALLAMREEASDTAATEYHGVVERYPLDGETVTRGDALYDAVAQVIDRSNVQQGIAALSRLLQTEHPAQPDFYIELGDAMRHAGDPGGGVDQYRQALQVDPHSARAGRRLGTALGSSGSNTEALQVLDEVLRHDPDNALVLYERGLIQSRSGNPGAAIPDFRHALTLEPDFADAQNSLGSALGQSGDSHGAETAFRAALQINPYDSITRANLGRLMASRGDWLQAAFHLQKAVELDRENAVVSSDLAIALLSLHRVDEAERQARVAVHVDSRCARAHDVLGQILAQQDHLGAALKEFQAALNVDADFGPAQIDLAQVLLIEGHTQAALPLLERAERSQSHAVADRAHGMLAQVHQR